MMAFTNDWLAENNPEPKEVVGGESLGRGIGMCQFNWRGLNINAVVMPYRIFMLQRIQDAYDALDAPAREAVMCFLPKLACRHSSPRGAYAVSP